MIEHHRKEPLAHHARREGEKSEEQHDKDQLQWATLSMQSSSPYPPATDLFTDDPQQHQLSLAILDIFSHATPSPATTQALSSSSSSSSSASSITLETPFSITCQLHYSNNLSNSATHHTSTSTEHTQNEQENKEDNSLDEKNGIDVRQKKTEKQQTITFNVDGDKSKMASILLMGPNRTVVTVPDGIFRITMFPLSAGYHRITGLVISFASDTNTTSPATAKMSNNSKGELTTSGGIPTTASPISAASSNPDNMNVSNSASLGNSSNSIGAAKKGSMSTANQLLIDKPQIRWNVDVLAEVFVKRGTTRFDA